MTRPLPKLRALGLKLRALGLGATLCAAVSGCAAHLDHFGKPPSFSAVAETRDPIDPSLPIGPGPHASLGHPNLAGAGRYPGVGTAGAPGRTAAAYAAYGPPPGVIAAPTRPDAPAAGRPSGRASLWNSGPGSLFGDQRAREVGDILTVLIEIDDSASLSNTTERTRSGSASITADTAFGLNGLLDRVIPGDTVALRNGLDTGGTSTNSGAGTVSRDESISLRIAARVVQVLANGHLVVTGNQEVRVNFELRDLQIAGIIRPEDITRQNTVTYDRMANARISYGGRGHISDFQQPRLGKQLVDMVSPF